MEVHLRAGLWADLRGVAASEPLLERNGPQESPLQDFHSWSLECSAQEGQETSQQQQAGLITVELATRERRS